MSPNFGTNIVYETWQLEYFEGNQNLDNISQPLQTEFNSPTLYFLPQCRGIIQWSGNLGGKPVEWLEYFFKPARQAPFIA